MDEQFINSTSRNRQEGTEEPDLEQKYEKDNMEEVVPLSSR